MWNSRGNADGLAISARRTYVAHESNDSPPGVPGKQLHRDGSEDPSANSRRELPSIRRWLSRRTIAKSKGTDRFLELQWSGFGRRPAIPVRWISGSTPTLRCSGGRAGKLLAVYNMGTA